MLRLDSSCADGGSHHDLEIKEVRIRAIWIKHGAVAAPLSFFSGGATTNPLTHWWVEIETTDRDIWFCAQFDKPYLELVQCSSVSEVTEVGKACIDRKNHDLNITNKNIFRPSGLTMREVYDWMQNCCDSKYSLIYNNCQDFGCDFSMRFGGGDPSNTPEIIKNMNTIVYRAAPLVCEIAKNEINRSLEEIGGSFGCSIQ